MRSESFGLTEDELRAEANRLYYAGWDLVEIMQRLEVPPKGTAV